MPTSEQLAERLAGLRRRRTELRLFRAAGERYESLSTRGARLHGGRWNPPGLAALYTSLEPGTVRAERARAAERQGIPEAALYPLRLVELALEARVLNLTAPAVLTSLGIEAPLSLLTPIVDTRAVGAAAAEAGIAALRVPSVAAPGDNIVVYPDNLEVPAAVVEETRLASPSDWP